MDNNDTAIDSIERVIAQYRALIEDQQQIIEAQSRTIEALQSITAHVQPSNTKQGVGRKPKAPEMDWVSWFADVRAQYMEAKAGRQKAGVVPILTWFIERELAEEGKPSGYVRRPNFQTKLRTLGKRISNARSPDRPIRMTLSAPQKFSGN